MKQCPAIMNFTQFNLALPIFTIGLNKIVQTITVLAFNWHIYSILRKISESKKMACSGKLFPFAAFTHLNEKPSKPPFLGVSEGSYVAGEGLEPTTSGL